MDKRALHFRPTRFWLASIVSAAFFGAFVVLYPGSGGARVRIDGGTDFIAIEAQQASVEEVLAALTGSHQLRYRSAVPLDRSVSGTYTGSLRAVIARILTGYDFVVKTSGTQFDIVVLGTSRGIPVAAAAEKKPAPGVKPTTSVQVAAPADSSAQQAAADGSLNVLPGMPVPPPKPAGQKLSSMLFNAAQVQIAPTAPTMASNAPAGSTSGAPLGTAPSAPAASDIAALTRSAAAQLATLRTALERVQK